MENNNEIMENNEVMVNENETGVDYDGQNDDKGSDAGLIALIAGGLVTSGVLLHKFVLQPIGDNWKAWRAERKSKKATECNDEEEFEDDIIDDDLPDDETEEEPKRKLWRK